MTMGRIGRMVLLGLAIGLGACFHEAPAKDTRPQAGSAAQEPGGNSYDYLALVLSWSPSFCETPAGARAPTQCGRSARPFAFVVHGLWPQNLQGWPEYCAGERAPWVEDATIRDAMRYMPSRDLILHEWRKHGTCMAADPADYFAATELLFESITIPKRYREPREHVLTSPESLKQAFLSANPQITADGISVHCGNRRDRANLDEIRICFDRDLNPRPCGSNERRQCRAETLVMPPVRTGG